MSLLEKATLITTPTAHSNGTLHSIKGGAVADFDVVRGSAATRVNAEGLIEDISILSEQITNGNFSNGSTDWNLENNWTIGNNAADGNGAVGSSGEIYQFNTFTSGRAYKVTYDILNYVSGSIQFQLAGGSTLSGTTRSANGTYTEYVVATANHTLIKFKSGTAFNASITNISVVETIDATNIPRIDYTTGEGVVLLEPQSTNLIPYSEDFRNSAWAKTRCTIDSGGHTSPSGESNAFKMTATDNDARLQDGTNPTGVIYTQSIYVKSATGSDVSGQVDFSGTQIVTFTATDQWQRVTTTSDNTRVGRVRIRITNSGDELLIWGAQVEALPYATSYIPTSGAIATRLADAVTGAGDATTFNSTEGVLYFEGSAIADSGDKRVISLSDGTQNNSIRIYFFETSNSIALVIKKAGTSSISESHNIGDATDNHKFAAKWSENDVALWVDGVEVDTVSLFSTFTPNTLNTLNFSRGNGTTNPFIGKVKALAVFNEALTDSELECLTKI